MEKMDQHVAETFTCVQCTKETETVSLFANDVSKWNWKYKHISLILK